MNYIRICNKVDEPGFLISEKDLDKYIDYNKELFISTYYYDQTQFDNFKQTKSVRGVKDVKTNKIWFDFDSTNPEISRASTIKTLERLTAEGIDPNDVEIYFSGNKGYHLILSTDRQLTPLEVQGVANKYAGDLQAFDTSLYDYTQIFRVPGTKHAKSGLHKIPLTATQLNSLTTEEIKHIATSVDNIKEDFFWKVISPKNEFFEFKKAETKAKVVMSDIDWTERPSHWKPYKWALLQGYFESGERHNALMIIAATCRALGYDKNTAYYMCKSAIKKQSLRTGTEEFPKEELFNDILKSVYSENWQGGAFSPKTNLWLAKYCERMGISVEQEKIPCVDIADMSKVFVDYANNFDKNIIKTGIGPLDDNVMLMASTHNGLLASPGTGKTTLAMEILKNTSKNDVSSLFMSMDMGLPIVFAKMIQRHMGISFKEAMHIYKTDPKQAAKIADLLKHEYKNVGFNFKSGIMVEDIKDIVKRHEDVTGKKVNLLVCDYLENITDKFSDMSANYALISNKMKDLANEMSLCSLMLLQTQKHSTEDISDPLLSMRKIKGSSTIEQSMSVILTAWRYGYNPKTIENDKYISLAAVKNRFGPLWSDDLGWKGKTGEVFALTSQQKAELDLFLEARARMRKEQNDNSGWS